MKAMILAAGVGSRLDPLTRQVPKPMVPIVNKPVMEYIVEMLARHGFTEIMVNLYHLGDQIEDYFKDGAGWGVKIQYSPEDQLWGDAGSVKRCEDFFDEDIFLVVGGDDLADVDLTGLVDFHRDKKALATIALSEVEDPSQYGIACLDDSARITRFLEKPTGVDVPSNKANTGIYLFDRRALELIPPGVPYGLGRQLCPELITRGAAFYGCLTSSYWKDVGCLEEYRQAHNDALDGKVGIELPIPKTSEGVWIGKNVEIDPSAQIGKPVFIGNNCRIEKGAKLLEYSVLGDDCVVEEGCEVRQSILWQGARVMRDTMLEGCIVGAGCSVWSNAAAFDGVIVDPVRRNGGK